MGRVSLELTLNELLLPACNAFWGSQTRLVSAYEKFKILSVTGGVPRYLEEINPHLSAEENIRLLAFSPSGILFHEFDRIFSDLFSKRSALYKRIVEVLAYGCLDFNQICQALHYEKSGALSQYLEDLIETGYMMRHYTWDLKTTKRSGLSQFRLKDNYLRFYLRYILPHQNQIQKGRLIPLPAWHSMMGLQFENLVLHNFHPLARKLHIPSGEVLCDGPFFQRPTQTQRGCQIDYLIQTCFHTLFVCEIKFSKDPIPGSILEEMREKIDRMKIPKHFSIRPVLIHVNGVTDVVIESGFFAHIVGFDALLEAEEDNA